MGQDLDPEKEAPPASDEESHVVAEAREALDDAREALLAEREHQADLRDAKWRSGNTVPMSATGERTNATMRQPSERPSTGNCAPSSSDGSSGCAT